MTPTDADRQRAREIVGDDVPATLSIVWLDELVDRIAAAIAAARAEALEQAAQAIVTANPFSTWEADVEWLRPPSASWSPAMASDEAERLAAIIDDLADEEHNHVVSPPPGTLSPEVIALCRKNEADFRAIAALLRTPPPAPEGWRVRDALVNLLDVLSLGPLGCAAKYGPDVDLREVEAAAFYQARIALDASPSPPAPERWRHISRDVLKHWNDYHGDLGSQHPAAAGHLQPHWDKFLLAMEHFEEVVGDASPAPPAHAELAARLRERAASLEDSDGMASDTSTLLREAATALGDGA